MVLRARPDSQTCEGMGTGRNRYQVQRSMGGVRPDAGSMAESDRGPRAGGGEAGLSRYIEWPRSAGTGAYPVANGITGISSRPFCAVPNGYRVQIREHAAKT